MSAAERPPRDPAASAAVFGEIYRRGEWDAEVRSGIGSRLEQTRRYVALLQGQLRRLGAKRVADLGCGDWTFSRLVDWSGLDYTGYDVVEGVIEDNRRRFARPGVSFEALDLLDGRLPAADLAICKDVLQHWPNAAVHGLLGRLGSFRYALLTNDHCHYRRPSWRTAFRRRPAQPTNVDIALGECRNLRLTEPPFGLVAERLAMLTMTHGELVWEKELLLWRNPRA